MTACHISSAFQVVTYYENNPLYWQVYFDAETENALLLNFHGHGDNIPILSHYILLIQKIRAIMVICNLYHITSCFC